MTTRISKEHSNFQFELKLWQLQQASPQTLSSAFKDLTEEVGAAKKTGKLDVFFDVLDRNKLLKKSCTIGSVKLHFLALKSIQYGLTDGTKAYKDNWQNLSEEALKVKIAKLLPKIKELRKDIPLDITKDEKKEVDQKLINRFKSTISRATRKLKSLSMNDMILSPTIKPTSTRSPLPSVFEVFDGKSEVTESSKSEGELTTKKEEESKEVFFGETQLFTGTLQNPTQRLLDFQKDLTRSLTEKGSAYQELQSRCSKEQLPVLERNLQTYLNEIFSRVEIDLILLKKQPETRDEPFEKSFISYSFLIHLYQTSLELDKAYIQRVWKKPELIDKMQTLLNCKEPLFKLMPQIDEMPILAGAKKRLENSQSSLAYEYLRSDNKKYTWFKYSQTQEHKLDPLKSSGLGHRPSAQELPKWLLSWIGSR